MRTVALVVALLGCGGGDSTKRADPPPTPSPPAAIDAAPVVADDACVTACTAESGIDCETSPYHSPTGVVCKPSYIHGKCLSKCGRPTPARWADDYECSGYCHYVEQDRGTPCEAVNLEPGPTAELAAACKRMEQP